MFFVFLIIVAIIVIIRKAVTAHRNKNAEPEVHVDDTEQYIPKPIMESAVRCKSCGGSFEIRSGDKFTKFCPFCGHAFEDIKSIVKDAQQTRRQDREYAIRMKELEIQKQEQEVNQQKAINDYNQQNSSTFALLILAVITVTIIGGLVFMTLSSK